MASPAIVVPGTVDLRSVKPREPQEWAASDPAFLAAWHVW